ncbi:MAG: succinate dehydrogenase iron-sulfur subunit [Pirellulales bacterium]
MSEANGETATATFEARVLRQPAPGQRSHWERFRISHGPDMNVISVLQEIAARPLTNSGEQVAPVAWDCNCLEEVCGACTMVINGRTRQACSALVDRLLEEHPGQIELRPMSKFPVVRDLMVDRTRLFRALTRAKAWVPVDDYYDRGAGPRQMPAEQQDSYPFSQCMSCGCCLEACPQYTKIELPPHDGETDEQFKARQSQQYDAHFLGAHAIGQTMLFNNHPTGRSLTNQRLDTLMGPGGIQICGNAQNCVAVCPKEIPLTTAIARAGRATTVRAIKKWFDS